MLNRSSEKSWGGLMILVVAIVLLATIKLDNTIEFFPGNTYQVSANFENIGGLKVGSPVTMAGVNIGRISAIKFDEKHHRSQVDMQIKSQFNNIPLDSSANVYTSGLLGEQYIGLLAGHRREYMQPGAEFQLTQSAIVLEQIVRQSLITKVAQK